MKINLVMCGGGMRLPAYIGALYAIRERGLEIDKLGGASAGSIVAALLASGRSPEDMRRLMHEVDFDRFRDFNPIESLKGMGLYSGNRFERWLDGELSGRRFKDTSKPLFVISTDIVEARPFVFSSSSTREMKVSEAVRCSIGIPGYFTFRKWEGKVLIDGNFVSGFSNELFAGDANRTIVLKLVSRGVSPRRRGAMGIRTYVKSLVNMLMSSVERERMDAPAWKTTILISTGDITATDFDLSKAERDYLFEQGYREMKRYVDMKLV